MTSRNIVLVTGGAGFLGQHVVRLLQTNADYVTEIRVLDVVPYTNKLDHRDRVNVTSYTGSVTDYNTVLEACIGANCVMHLAGFVDTRLVPDEKLSYKVNVKGTENVIRACKAAEVKRLLYCSSMDVVIGQKNIYNGNEENTQLTLGSDNFFPVYGPSKGAAESLVLHANSPTLRTVALRPGILYGELDPRFYATMADTIHTLGRYVRLDSTGGVMLFTYVGNVAWSFICADKTLLQDDRSRKASGNAYFICDDSPRKDLFAFHDSFLMEAGAKPFPVTIPLWLTIYPTYILYFIVILLRLVFNVNFSFGIEGYLVLRTTFTFSYNKATQELGYKPVFSVEEAKQRSVKYLNGILNRRPISEVNS